MTQLFANNASTNLSLAVGTGDTSFTVVSGGGAAFPSPTGGDFFAATLAHLDVNGAEISREIVYCTARSVDTFTVTRAQEGTTALSLSAGDKVEARVTSGTLTAFVQTVSGHAGPVVALVKADVGLGNVDNTSDANKPVSTAQAAAIAAKQDTLVSGTNIKTLNGNSLLGSGNLAISAGLTPTVVSASTAMQAGKLYVTTTPGITLTMPATPSTGDQFGVSNASGGAVLVAFSGLTVKNATPDAPLSVPSLRGFVVVYTGGTLA
ncbi:MAG: hypothetical protein AzoDbin1_05195 [Azoarcus sp.]|nr:hypothetical protein [Azoarcus sp.]